MYDRKAGGPSEIEPQVSAQILAKRPPELDTLLPQLGNTVAEVIKVGRRHAELLLAQPAESFQHLDEHFRRETWILLRREPKQLGEVKVIRQRSQVDEIASFGAAEYSQHFVHCQLRSAQEREILIDYQREEAGVRRNVHLRDFTASSHYEANESHSLANPMNIQPGGPESLLSRGCERVHVRMMQTEEVEVLGLSLDFPVDDQSGATGEPEPSRLRQFNDDEGDFSLKRRQHRTYTCRLS